MRLVHYCIGGVGLKKSDECINALQDPSSLFPKNTILGIEFTIHNVQCMTDGWEPLQAVVKRFWVPQRLI